MKTSGSHVALFCNLWFKCGKGQSRDMFQFPCEKANCECGDESLVQIHLIRSKSIGNPIRVETFRWKTKQADLMMVLKEVGESLKSLSTIVWGARMFLQNLMAIHPSIDNAIPWAMMLTWVKNLLSTQSSLCSYVLNQTANLGINRYNTQPPNVLCSQQSGR